MRQPHPFLSVPPRIAYLDLDGTLTRDGSMFHGADGLTLAGAQAIHHLHAANVHIVPASGRTVAQMHEIARFLGTQSFIAELGSVLVRGYDETPTYDLSIWPGARSDVAADVLARLAVDFDVEPHEPWASMREHTLLLRGPMGLERSMRESLQEFAPHLTAIDNGEVERGRHAYHVLPRGVSKGLAVARDLRERALARSDAVAFGDSDGDREMVHAVETFYHIGGTDGERIVGVAKRFAEGLLDAVTQALAQE